MPWQEEVGIAVGSVTVDDRPIQVANPQTQKETETQEDGNHSLTIAAIAATLGLLFILVVGFFVAKSRSTKRKPSASINEANCETNDKVEQKVTASMEEGKSLDKKMEDESDNNSTNCPSSDAHSDLASTDEHVPPSVAPID